MAGSETFISPADGNEVFQAKYIPKQKGPLAPNHPSMKLFVSSSPSAVAVSYIHSRTSVITALLEVDQDRVALPWQLSLHYCTVSDGKGSREWSEAPMTPLSAEATKPSSLYVPEIPSRAALHRLYFRASLEVPEPTKFTIKFRGGPDDHWQSIATDQGSEGGLIIPRIKPSQESASVSLADCVGNLNPSLKVSHHRSQSPDTTLWSVEVPTEAAEGEKSTIKDVVFGTPWGTDKYSLVKWFSLIRIWSPWLAPRHGKLKFDLDKEAVLSSFLNHSGQHLVLLAISGVEDVMTLITSDSDGNAVLRVRNDSSEPSTARVLVGLGNDFESANCAVMYHARGVIAAAKAASGEAQKEVQALEHDEASTKMWSENWYDGLTYCTWNALGQRLTEDKIVKAVETLAENKINITNFIIDDNWQSIDYRGNGQFQHGWNEFEAEPKAFPKGLKHTVDLIRQKQPSIQHVAVWHAILGYWGGISPDGKIAKTYKTVEVVREDALRRNLPLGGKMTVVAKEDVSRFYNDFYSFLSSCGVDAVKTDAQFMLDTFISAKARSDLISTYLDAWTISTLRHFSIKAISCMSQTPQILFHSQMAQNRPPILVRNSDDFFPEIPTSHPWHIFTNAHNALFTQHLNVVPDWDMFQTVHDYSGFHAAARCVSGGPIYITDVPGQHDLNLIGQMTGPTLRGKTVIFRPSVLGKALDQYNGYDDDNLLLVGAYHGAAGVGTGFAGVFNISQKPLSELISLSKFPGVEASDYIIRSHGSGRVTSPMRVEDPASLIHVSLGVRGYDILSSYPLQSFRDGDEEFQIANLGLLGKMTGAAAIVRSHISKLENGMILVKTSLKALGVLGLYISNLPTAPFGDRMLITILGNVIPVHTVRVSPADPHVLEIDAETAWKELGLESRWSNELEVAVNMKSPSSGGN